jgi:hypothetical protein
MTIHIYYSCVYFYESKAHCNKGANEFDQQLQPRASPPPISQRPIISIYFGGVGTFLRVSGVTLSNAETTVSSSTSLPVSKIA